MSEIKINSISINKLIDEVNNSGSNIDTSGSNVSDADVETLITSKKYISQHIKIAELLDLYKDLIEKDCKDIKNMIDEITNTDEKISKNMITK